MLNIPQEIKDLLHLDSCKKNIRIHFPNGERSDICNNLIVKNSVSFKESLCSQDTLKFGLCESPVFECETVGVGDIKGATIEVFCEVFCDSTVSGAEWRSDLESYVYAIPYGTFTVDSCRRQGDILHRKIIAYSGASLIENLSDPLIRNIVQMDWSSSADYKPKAFCFAIPNAGRVDLQELSKTSISYDLSAYGIDFRWYNPEYPHDSYQNMHAAISLSGQRYTLTSNFNSLYSAYVYGVKDYTEEVVNFLNIYGINWPGDPPFVDESGLKWINLDAYVSDSTGSSNTASYRMKPGTNYINLYPYGGSGQTRAEIFIPTGSISITITNDYGGQERTVDVLTIEGPIAQSAYLYRRGFENEYAVLDLLTLTIPRIKNTSSLASVYNCNMKNIPTSRDILNNSLEVIGRFGFFDRSNSFRMLTLKRMFRLRPEADLYPGLNLYPLGVTGGRLYPEDYSSCWYDDEFTKPFGAVVCTYKDTNSVDSTYTLYLPGYSSLTDKKTYQVYEISGNAIISGLLLTLAQVRLICESIANSVSGVSYIPVDFKGRGLPYVEAGDTFEILTKSNESITTIVLNRTLTGELTLTDLYKSNGSGLQQ